MVMATSQIVICYGGCIVCRETDGGVEGEVEEGQ